MPYAEAPDDAPLKGVRVADFSHVLAGPFCTRMLCDLGAEVIKIETPDGDLARKLGARRGGMSGYFMQQNCGKRNVSVDLQQARGRDLAESIVSHCDVLVENLRPGVLERFGLGHERLCGAQPRLIYCSISGFGDTGPWSGQRAFAGIAHASTGMLHRQHSHTGGECKDSVLAIGDTVSGLQATVAILAALALRERSGTGQYIDMAMHDALLSVQEAANFHMFADDGEETDFLCSWVYRCGEHDVVMPTDPRAHWERFATIMGSPELATDERYDSYDKREQRLDELEAHIHAWVASVGDASQVVATLHAGGFPGARVMTMGEALDCEQTRVRAMTPEVDDRSGGSVRVLSSPYRYSRASAGVRGVAAFRGEDNREVLTELLGMSSTEIDDLEAAGVISARLPSTAMRG